MGGKNYYNVTEWNIGNPYEDIGEVINSIISDIKARQADADMVGLGRPGAEIYIPAGDYHLASQVVIDISYLKIKGSGHGFTSSSIRFNTPQEEWGRWHELWPGGSHIMVDLPPVDQGDEAAGAAFYVKREGNPRISSVEFTDFCVDGLHFLDDGTGIPNPENSYTNGKTGIYVESPGDSFRITGMGFVYLEHGITFYHADALSIHDNFIAECGNCIELRGSGQASKITDNLIGAGYKGYSIYAQNFGGLLVALNNVFPRGASCIYFDTVTRSSVTSNRFHAFYPGMAVLKNCSENLVSSNHFFRDREPWPPMQGYDNGLEDLYGLIYVSGNYNSIIGNHISEVIDEQFLKPQGVKPVAIRLVSGKGNHVADNHIVATAEVPKEFTLTNESCFFTQVEALLTAGNSNELDIITVLAEKEATHNTVLDSGTEEQVVMDKSINAFRAAPGV